MYENGHINVSFTLSFFWANHSNVWRDPMIARRFLSSSLTLSRPLSRSLFPRSHISLLFSSLCHNASSDIHCTVMTSHVLRNSLFPSEERSELISTTNCFVCLHVYKNLYVQKYKYRHDNRHTHARLYLYIYPFIYFPPCHYPPSSSHLSVPLTRATYVSRLNTCGDIPSIDYIYCYYNETIFPASHLHYVSGY